MDGEARNNSRGEGRIDRLVPGHGTRRGPGAASLPRIAGIRALPGTLAPCALPLAPAPDAMPTSEALGELAGEFQNLPVASLAPAIVLLLGGLLLLVAGRHFLRPVLVVTSVLLAALLGTPLLAQVFPRVGEAVLVFLAAATGLVLVAITWRLMLGTATGIVAAFACASVAMIGVDAGFIDARSAADAPPASVSLDEIAARDEIVERAPTLVRPLVRWADARWHSEPPQVRTLLKAAAAGGAFIGLVLGVWLPQSSAAFLTSLVGGLFVLVGGMPFLARVVDRAAEPMPPLAWLALWAALALAGWIVQSSRDASAARSNVGAGDPNDGAEPDGARAPTKASERR